MGLVIELKVDQSVLVAGTLITVRRAARTTSNKIRLHFEGPDKVTRIKEVTNGSNDPITKEK